MAAKPEAYKSQPIRTNILRAVVGLEIGAAFLTAVMTLFPILTFFPIAADIYWSSVHYMRYLPSLATVGLLIWIFRANARAQSNQALDHRPAWAVWLVFRASGFPGQTVGCDDRNLPGQPPAPGLA